MNTERAAKIAQTKLANAAAIASQTITIDTHWKIQRVDERNWEVQYKGKFRGFYGDLASALRNLPAKMLSEEASGTLADVLRCHKAIVERLETALGEVTKNRV